MIAALLVGLAWWRWARPAAMCLTGLTRAMYLAVCKDTDDLHVERVHADGDAAERLLAKAGRIIHAARPPARCSEDPSWFECRLCDHHDLCHGEAAAAITCSSCLHATPAEGGWTCARWAPAITDLEQRAACDRHLYVPDLVPGEAIDAGHDLVYRMRDGSTWINDAREAVAC